MDVAFPGFEWNAAGDGLLIVREAYSLEVARPATRIIASLHISLRTGSSWQSDGENEFYERLGKLCQSNGWQAFAVSDNSRID